MRVTAKNQAVVALVIWLIETLAGPLILVFLAYMSWTAAGWIMRRLLKFN